MNDDAIIAETPLFRHRAPVGARVFDVHVNALGPGVTAPVSFYAAVTAAAVEQTRASAGCASARFVGGCMSPPAGVPLQAASESLRQWTLAHPQWQALLRLDPDSALRPVTGPAAAARGWLRRATARRTAAATLHHADDLQGYAGIKLMPHATGLPDAAALDVIGASGLPVLVHSGILCPPRWLQQHLLPALQGPLILAHLGSWPCAADELSEAVALAADDPRIYLETSGASIGHFIGHAVEKVPHKVLFGSNTPMCPASVQWSHVAASIGDDALLQAIGFDNAARVFDLSSVTESMT